MAQYGRDDFPDDVQQQLALLLDGVQTHLGRNLLGAYLHGSLAMGCFNPRHSDLDLLVITHSRIPIKSKIALAELLLGVSRKPYPIEISFLCQTGLSPWVHPTPYDLHYSEDWRQSYERDLVTGAWTLWETETRSDPDLAAHITVTRQRGVHLCGPGVADIFPAVPARDYVASILGDVEAGLQDIGRNPVYAILNACRTLAYLREGQVLSKAEGGAWGEQGMPWAFRSLIATALAVYRGDLPASAIPQDRLDAFALAIRSELSTMDAY